MIKTLIKTRQHNVVLVQNVHPFSTSPLDTPVPNARQTIVRRLLMHGNPISGNPANQLHGCTIGRTIVHHLDLHLSRPGILLQDTF
jgi:hypothetical protein